MYRDALRRLSNKPLSLKTRIIVTGVAGAISGFIVGLVSSGSLPVAAITAIIAPFPVVGVFLRTRYMAQHIGWKRRSN